MKPKWFVVLGVCIAVASLLSSCSPPPPVVPVTGNESVAVPNIVDSARDFSSIFIQNKYAAITLPENDAWRVTASLASEAADETLYSFTSGTWLVIVREPNENIAPLGITYLNTETGFVWQGFLDRDGNVVEMEYVR